LKATDTRVEIVTGDIAEPDTAERLVAAVRHAGFQPAGVLHSAVVLADEIVLNMTESAAAKVFAPKVAGHWWLHLATADLDLDWWMTNSSASSLLGSPGQGAYAAANAWVDGLVSYRRSLGLPAVGINWGPWAEVGRAQFFAGLGFSMITAEQGMAAMEAVLAADRAHTGVFSLDAQQWFQSFPAAQESSLFAKLAESHAVTVERGDGGRIRAELDATDPAERPARLASATRSHATHGGEAHHPGAFQGGDGRRPQRERVQGSTVPAAPPQRPPHALMAARLARGPRRDGADLRARDRTP
jgi:phthiocerol/phenolphthiocerol synthesis type-I polyketide synthase C